MLLMGKFVKSMTCQTSNISKLMKCSQRNWSLCKVVCIHSSRMCIYQRNNYDATTDNRSGIVTRKIVHEDDTEVSAKSEESDVTMQIFNEDKKFTHSEWVQFIEKLQTNIRPLMRASDDVISAFILKQCLKHENYIMATSYMDYLKHKGMELNLSAHAYYLMLCSNSINICGEKLVLDLYYQLLERTKVLDTVLGSAAIKAITKTCEWKNAIKHLADIRRLGSVTESTISAIIAAAFRHGENELGWKLCQLMQSEAQSPREEAFQAWLEHCQMEKCSKESSFENLLQNFRHYKLVPYLQTGQEITLFCQQHKLNWQASQVDINRRGICPTCGTQLTAEPMITEDFKLLQMEFLERVVKRSDIFQTTSPGEWTKFDSFLEHKGPFAYVVDGLNVSYMGNSHDRIKPYSSFDKAKTLRMAVSKLAEKCGDGRILVIGRNHMLRWSPLDLDIIRNFAHLYLLNNLSKDDSFFIYAALKSGSDTFILSNDYLRDSMYLLHDVNLRQTMRQWLQQRQISVVGGAHGFKLQHPPIFSYVTQETTDGRFWHVPLEDPDCKLSPVKYPRQHWLCLAKTSTNKDELNSLNDNKIAQASSSKVKKSTHPLFRPETVKKKWDTRDGHQGWKTIVNRVFDDTGKQ